MEMINKVCFHACVYCNFTNFGVVVFSVFSVVNGFTEIKKTPEGEKNTLSDHDSIYG